MKSKLFRDVMVLAILGLLSAVVGIGFDQIRANPIGLSYVKPSQRAANESKSDGPLSVEVGEGFDSISREIRIIKLGELTGLLEKKQALVFDVRPNIFFKLGHIPGSFSLQEKEFETDFGNSRPMIEAALAKGLKIAVYCSGVHCSDASKVAKRLAALGYWNLMIFEGGFEAWQAAGLEEEQDEI